jgi:hypothetical protein
VIGVLFWVLGSRTRADVVKLEAATAASTAGTADTADPVD